MTFAARPARRKPLYHNALRPLFSEDVANRLGWSGQLRSVFDFLPIKSIKLPALSIVVGEVFHCVFLSRVIVSCTCIISTLD